MTTRSPWATLNVAFGEDLPPLLRHHVHPHSYGLTRRWLHIANDSTNKPMGGLWTAPAILPPGKWRPIPRRSTWTQWCSSEEPHWINGHYQTQLFPRRDAVFAVIDSGADARALYEAFPDDTHPAVLAMQEAAREHPELADIGGGMFRHMIDWRAVLDRQIAGVWLTDRGLHDTRMPDDPDVPALYTWDAASVWFSQPAYRIGETWPCPRIDPDPYDSGWDEKGEYADPEAVRERIRNGLEEARGMGWQGAPEDAPETPDEEP